VLVKLLLGSNKRTGKH